MLKQFKRNIFKLFLFILIYILLVCGAMFFIQANMQTNQKCDIEEAVKLGKNVTINYSFHGILLKQEIVRTHYKGAILQVDAKNYPALFYMPLLLAGFVFVVLILLITIIKRLLSNHEL